MSLNLELPFLCHIHRRLAGLYLAEQVPKIEIVLKLASISKVRPASAAITFAAMYPPAHIVQLRLLAKPLAAESRIRVGRRAVGLNAALFAMEVLAVVGVIVMIFRLEGPQRSTGFNEVAVHREVLFRRQLLRVSLLLDRVEQQLINGNRIRRLQSECIC